MKFRKKPVVIEAYRTRELLHAAANTWTDLPECIVKAYDAGNILFLPDTIEIKTLEGWHRADINDMIIKGVAGELYPCKPDIFDQTYDRVES